MADMGDAAAPEPTQAMHDAAAKIQRAFKAFQVRAALPPPNPLADSAGSAVLASTLVGAAMVGIRLAGDNAQAVDEDDAKKAALWKVGRAGAPQSRFSVALNQMAVTASQTAASSAASGVAAGTAAATVVVAGLGVLGSLATMAVVVAGAVVLAIGFRGSRNVIATGLDVVSGEYCADVLAPSVLNGLATIDFVGVPKLLDREQAEQVSHEFREAYNNAYGCDSDFSRLSLSCEIPCDEASDSCCAWATTDFGQVMRCPFQCTIHCDACPSFEPFFATGLTTTIGDEPQPLEIIRAALPSSGSTESEGVKCDRQCEVGLRVRDATCSSLDLPAGRRCFASEISSYDTRQEEELVRVVLEDPDSIPLPASPTTMPSSNPSSNPSGTASLAPTSRPSKTQFPTADFSPSVAPSMEDSQFPTTPPSAVDSDAPTAAASELPTGSPSHISSISPSQSLKPSAAVSEIPTTSPSVAPVMELSSEPSVAVSEVPTTSPSVAPVMELSSEPTVAVSEVPTTSPSVAPVVELSSEPSVAASELPTAGPTETGSFGPTTLPSTTVSQLPTGSPSFDGSQLPTVSQFPTGIVSDGPSVSPSLWPSSGPAVESSNMPSSFPAAVASVPPSAVPSASPRPTRSRPTIFPSEVPSLTSVPTTAPTGEPSLSPSLDPSDLPTTRPTFGPSVSPSHVPSIAPSTSPTIGPTISPSHMPSTLPSSGPSVVPSSLPSEGPSPSPSHTPSAMPSNSVLPSTVYAPSSFPSVSAAPSGKPSIKLSEAPSGAPSKPPSRGPTTTPSATPTTTPSEPPSRGPTTTPSATPTTTPSRAPSILPSILPTSAPSIMPSSLPSESPTRGPTISPSRMPSTLPSAGPTVVPSSLPSEGPSPSPSLTPSAMPSDSALPSTVYAPSSSPSFSAAPSGKPSIKLSEAPSGAPSKPPSRGPTTTPSATPTTTPSEPPSRGPTTTPSATPTTTPSEPPSRAPSILPSALPSTSLPSSAPSNIPSVEPSTFPSEAACPPPGGTDAVFTLVVEGSGGTIDTVRTMTNGTEVIALDEVGTLLSVNVAVDDWVDSMFLELDDRHAVLERNAPFYLGSNPGGAFRRVRQMAVVQDHILYATPICEDGERGDTITFLFETVETQASISPTLSPTVSLAPTSSCGGSITFDLVRLDDEGREITVDGRFEDVSSGASFFLPDIIQEEGHSLSFEIVVSLEEGLAGLDLTLSKDGELLFNRDEVEAPYYLSSDILSLDFIRPVGELDDEGSFTIVVIPDCGDGVLGPPSEVTFTFSYPPPTLSPSQAPTYQCPPEDQGNVTFILVEEGAGGRVAPIRVMENNTEIIDLSVDGGELSIMAEVGDWVDAVKFFLEDGFENVETISPFVLGSNPSGNFLAVPNITVPGPHVLTLQPRCPSSDGTIVRGTDVFFYFSTVSAMPSGAPTVAPTSSPQPSPSPSGEPSAQPTLTPWPSSVASEVPTPMPTSCDPDRDYAVSFTLVFLDESNFTYEALDIPLMDGETYVLSDFTSGEAIGGLSALFGVTPTPDQVRLRLDEGASGSLESNPPYYLAGNDADDGSVYPDEILGEYGEFTRLFEVRPRCDDVFGGWVSITVTINNDVVNMPTPMPSGSPTVTLMPSAGPSLLPTIVGLPSAAPSLAPSVSDQPSSVPTSVPVLRLSVEGEEGCAGARFDCDPRRPGTRRSICHVAASGVMNDLCLPDGAFLAHIEGEAHAEDYCGCCDGSPVDPVTGECP